MQRKKNNKEVVSEVEVVICAKYLARIDKKAIYNSVYNFNVGGYVFLKKDFDTNKANKRLKFDPFFHPEAILKKFSEN